MMRPQLRMNKGCYSSLSFITRPPGEFGRFITNPTRYREPGRLPNTWTSHATPTKPDISRRTSNKFDRSVPTSNGSAFGTYPEHRSETCRAEISDRRGCCGLLPVGSADDLQQPQVHRTDARSGQAFVYARSIGSLARNPPRPKAKNAAITVFYLSGDSLDSV